MHAFMMEIGDRRAERVEAALSLIFASPLEGGVANERCNVSVCPWQSAKTMTSGPLAVKISPSP